jgi:hypothetical protein
MIWKLTALLGICLAAAIGAPVAMAQPGEKPGPVDGLPAGAAEAALRPEPALPTPAGWPEEDAFPRTSGTGRLIGGALQWTDWVYDDHGAASTSGNLPGTAPTQLAPVEGTYVYPEGKAHGNGADIFRAAVAVTGKDTLWRVDWNTLDDAGIPIAEWTFDTDDNAKTGATAWPAQANVTSPGIERALVVSAKGARLLDANDGKVLATFPTAVDLAARSFVVRIPRTALPIGGQWKVRLAAGIADAAGSAFAPPTTSNGEASADAPRVYNVTFRSSGQEPPRYEGPQTGAIAAGVKAAMAQTPVVGGYGQELPNTLTANFWAEDHQAQSLLTGDVSEFGQVVRWSDLVAKKRTEPAVPKGVWSQRWLVNDFALGQGQADGYPTYVGRVQPYTVYVPRSYDGSRRVPLTLVLHSAQSNYMQYAALNPRLAEKLCEDRGSICATGNGFGGGALYGGDLADAEVWQMWRQLALGFKIDDDHTVVTGYSAGGVGSFRMSHNYPSVFAAAMPLDGGFEEQCSSGAPGARNFVIATAPDRSRNVRWVPEVMSSAFGDELSLYPGVLEQANRFLAAGDRFSFFTTTFNEHIAAAIADGFGAQIDELGGTPERKRRPGTIDYTWCPQVVDAKHGLGPTSVYWLSGLRQRNTSSPSTTSRVRAADAALPEAPTTNETTQAVIAPPDSTPMHLQRNRWKLGAPAVSQPKLTLGLTNIADLAVDTAESNLPTGEATVTSDGPASLTLAELPRATEVRSGSRTWTPGRDRRVTLTVGAGQTTITWSSTAGLRSCASRRAFVIHLPKAMRRATVSVAGKRIRVTRGRRRLIARVNLRGRKKMTVKVTAVGRSSTGKRLRQTRTYRTCTKRGR